METKTGEEQAHRAAPPPHQHRRSLNVNAVGKTELEEEEEGSDGGGRHIKAADFDEEECGRKFHGSRASPREPPPPPRNRPREDGGCHRNS
jgi:hypothetical protein